jgi:hypothetical protein
MSKQILDFMKSVDVRSLSAAEAQEYLGVLADWQRQIAGAAPSMPFAPAFVRKVESPNRAKYAVPSVAAQPLPSVSELQQASMPHGPGNFKNISLRYRRAFGVSLSHSRRTTAAYAEQCQRFGEDFVLSEFDTWQQANQWIRDKNFANGMAQFYDTLPAAAEVVAGVQADEAIAKRTKEKEETAVTDAVEAGRSAALLAKIRQLEKKKREDAAVKQVAENPEELFS